MLDMSSRKGNNKKQGQRHQNKTAYRNDLHDTSKRTKLTNSLVVGGVCSRCKEVIDWKIKYKKYKPLKDPKKCTACLQKTVKRAYYTICISCAQSRGVCAKCGQKSDIVESFPQSEREKEAEEVEFQFMLRQMTERKKRSFLREHSSSHKAGKKTTSREEDPSLSSVSSSDDNDELLGEEEDPSNCDEDVPETEEWEDPGDYEEEVPETGVEGTERTESSNMLYEVPSKHRPQ